MMNTINKLQFCLYSFLLVTCFINLKAQVVEKKKDELSVLLTAKEMPQKKIHKEYSAPTETRPCKTYNCISEGLSKHSHLLNKTPYFQEITKGVSLPPEGRNEIEKKRYMEQREKEKIGIYCNGLQNLIIRTIKNSGQENGEEIETPGFNGSYTIRTQDKYILITTMQDGEKRNFAIDTTTGEYMQIQKRGIKVQDIPRGYQAYQVQVKDMGFLSTIETKGSGYLSFYIPNKKNQTITLSLFHTTGIEEITIEINDHGIGIMPKTEKTKVMSHENIENAWEWKKPQIR